MVEVFTRYIEERRVEGKPLGRHVAHDPRSKDYVAEQADTIEDVLHTGHGLPLNQGQIGACTAFATCAALNSLPDSGALKGKVKGHTFTNKDGDQLYGRETADEGQPWPPNDPGGSGLYVCKAARELSWITKYTHTFSMEAALKALMLHPVIWGVNWYDSFDNPDPETGVCSIADGAQVRGGHEICAVEIKASEQLVGFWQSWGPWGLDNTGRFYIGFGDCERLLSEQGDVTVPLP
jgi:hypothetical protein